MNPFEGLDDAFGTEPAEIQKHENVKPQLKKSDTEDVKPVSYTHLTLPTTPYV